MPSSKKKFWRQFVKSRKEIGSITPSSRFLTRGIMNKIDFVHAGVIVELGPGTGVFTVEILKRMTHNCKLIVVELNAEMYNELKKKINDPRVVLVHGSANDLSNILASNGLTHVDYIVSGLPLSVMPQEIAENIIKTSSDVLSQNGRYIQFMYTLLFKKKMLRHFSSLTQSYIFLNFPPAFIFECQKS